MNPQPPPSLAASLLINKLLAVSLISGVGFFLLIAGFVTHKPMARAGSSPLEWVVVAMLAAALALSPILARVVATQALKQISAGDVAAQDPVELGRRLLQVYQVRMLAELAPLEGASLVGAIVFFIQPSPVGLAVALTGMGAMALRFPTKARVESWLADTVRALRG